MEEMRQTAREAEEAMKAYDKFKEVNRKSEHGGFPNMDEQLRERRLSQRKINISKRR
jgi:hypothetical protein